MNIDIRHMLRYQPLEHNLIILWKHNREDTRVSFIAITKDIPACNAKKVCINLAIRMVVVGIGIYNTLLLPCDRSRLLQQRGRVFAFRSCGSGSIPTSDGWDFSSPCDICMNV